MRRRRESVQREEDKELVAAGSWIAVRNWNLPLTASCICSRMSGRILLGENGEDRD